MLCNEELHTNTLQATRSTEKELTPNNDDEVRDAAVDAAEGGKKCCMWEGDHDALVAVVQGGTGTLRKEGASENSAASKLGSRLFSKSKQTN